MSQYQPLYYSSNNSNRLPLTPNSISPPSSDSRECTVNEIPEQSNLNSSDSLHEFPQEITWLFFRDNKWVPFQSNNHYKIEQAFTLGGIYQLLQFNVRECVWGEIEYVFECVCNDCISIKKNE